MAQGAGSRWPAGGGRRDDRRPSARARKELRRRFHGARNLAEVGDHEHALLMPERGKPSVPVDTDEGLLRRATVRTLVLGAVLLTAAIPTLGYWWGVHPVSETGGLNIPWWALAGLFVLGELLVFEVEIGREAHTFTFSEVPLVLGLFVASPFTIVVARLGAEVSVLTMKERQRPAKLAFNSCMVIAECAVAITVFQLVSSQRDIDRPMAWLAATLAVLGADAVSLMCVAWAIRWHDAVPELRQLVAVGAVTGLANVALGLTAGILLTHNLAAVVLLASLVSLFYLLYRGYAKAILRLEGLQLFQNFTEDIGSIHQPEQVLRLIVTKARLSMRADYARIEVVAPGDDSCFIVESRQAEPSTVVHSHRPSVTALLKNTSARTVVESRGFADTSDRPFSSALSTRDCVVAALTNGNKLLGTLSVGDRIGQVSSFDRNDADLLQNLASYAAVAIENGRLIDELNREVSDREHNALHDELTGLPNRRHLFEATRAALLAASAKSERQVALALLDLDRFKEINDTLGHHVGDVVLVSIARRLRNHLPGDVLLARLGGDEFAMLYPCVMSPDEALRAAADLRELFAAPFIADGVNLAVGASIGIAMGPDHANDPDTLLQRADVAMYTAKHSHVGGGIALYDPTCDDHSRQRLELAAELRNAIGHGELVVYYQPKASLRDGTVIGVEALVRWRHPDRGIVPPDEFINIAEQTGTIGELTTYVLDEALAQCAHWQRRGYSMPISVNLSPVSLVDSQLADSIAAALQRAGVQPDLLTLEITENSVVELGRSTRALEQLAALGAQISIDDFGTGFTSLAYLHALPVHEVKIDRSFVATLTDSHDSATIVKTIIDLGHNLHLRVVAEGVENDAAWQHLAALGCDIAQGYLLTPPLPPAELDAWHMTWTDGYQHLNPRANITRSRA